MMTKKPRGRPPIGDRAMTSTEINRRRIDRFKRIEAKARASMHGVAILEKDLREGGFTVLADRAAATLALMRAELGPE